MKRCVRTNESQSEYSRASRALIPGPRRPQPRRPAAQPDAPYPAKTTTPHAFRAHRNTANISGALARAPAPAGSTTDQLRTTQPRSVAALTMSSSLLWLSCAEGMLPGWRVEGGEWRAKGARCRVDLGFRGWRVDGGMRRCRCGRYMSLSTPELRWIAVARG